MDIKHRFIYGGLDKVLQVSAMEVQDFQPLFQAEGLSTDIPKVIGVYQPTVFHQDVYRLQAQKQRLEIQDSINPNLIAVVYNPDDFRTDYFPEEFGDPLTLQQIIDSKNSCKRVRAHAIDLVKTPSYYQKKPFIEIGIAEEVINDIKARSIEFDEGLEIFQDEHNLFSYANKNFGLTLKEAINLGLIETGLQEIQG